jgi:hypothetical protein
MNASSMDDADQTLIESLHQAPFRYVLALTGGGAQASGWLLTVPGGSRTILEVHVPYHDRALADFLGRTPEHYCSPETAIDMAVHAEQRAAWLAPGEDVFGVGCTASLATDRPKRGDHRFHLAVSGVGRLRTASLTLAKEARDRAGEEQVLDLVLLNELRRALQVPTQLPVPLLPGEEVVVEERPVGELGRFHAGLVPVLCVQPDGRQSSAAELPRALLSGAFNPVHAAHLRLAEVAAGLLGLPVEFEMSVTNVDKPPLSFGQMVNRLARFAGRAPLWLTREPTFVGKAGLFPGVTFVVGADTAARIVQPRYYPENKMTEVLAFFHQQGCRFLVAGRSDESGRYLHLEDLGIGPELRDLFEAIPQSAFQLDLSSTQLRERQHSPKGVE